MASKRVSVEVPGDNSHTVDDLRDILNRCPWDAKIRTQSRAAAGADPVIIIWWDEEL